MAPLRRVDTNFLPIYHAWSRFSAAIATGDTKSMSVRFFRTVDPDDGLFHQRSDTGSRNRARGFSTLPAQCPRSALLSSSSAGDFLTLLAKYHWISGATGRTRPVPRWPGRFPTGRVRPVAPKWSRTGDQRVVSVKWRWCSARRVDFFVKSEISWPPGRGWSSCRRPGGTKGGACISDSTG
jgi:hypothetical protein